MPLPIVCVGGSELRGRLRGAPHHRLEKLWGGLKALSSPPTGALVQTHAAVCPMCSSSFDIRHALMRWPLPVWHAVCARSCAAGGLVLVGRAHIWNMRYGPCVQHMPAA